MTEQTAKTAEKALRLRKRLKQKKPKFVRPESWRYVRLKESWRRPRGLDHKVRLKYDGWPPGVSVGYRGPKATRGLHPSGFREVLVHNAEELKNVDPKLQVIRIAHTVGKRNRTQIITEARKKKIRILNVKVAKEAIAEKEELTEEEKLEAKEEEKEIEEPEKPKQKGAKAKKQKEETKEP
jgi:large subunit ribosomal protein L32e